MNRLQFRILYHDFLGRMIDLEILSAHAQGDATTLLGQFAALLILVSFILSILATVYATARMPMQGLLLFGWSGEHTLIATTMLTVGLFAVLSWDSTFPDRRDVMVLAPLPVRARTIFLAKVAAIAAALSLTVLTLNLLAGIAWPLALNRTIPTAAQTTWMYTKDPATPPLDAAAVESLLDHEIAGSRVLPASAGVAIGVVKHGVRRVFAYGAAKPDSLFEIGSISKTFTALMLAQMVAQGKVRLDEPVRELLPAGTVARPAGEEITLADLATHHSGLPRMPSNFDAADRDNPYADYHAADLYAYLSRHGLAKTPNAPFLYSNLGFGLLGQALAERAGMSYADLLNEAVTGPLGLRDTVVSFSPGQQRRFIPGHNGQYRPVHAWDLDALAGAGAIRSTAGDLLTYLEAQLHPHNAGPLAQAIEMTHALRAEGFPASAIGLAWFYDAPIPGTHCYWHGGATAGYTSDVFFSPQNDFAAVVLFSTGPNALGFADWLSEHIRQKLAGEPAFSLRTVDVSPGGSLTGFLRVFAAYWITMLASGVFIFCAVLLLQGIGAQLLPRRLFLRVSSLLQLAAFCLLVSVYFLEPKIAAPLTLIEAQGNGLLAWSPSYWFLGLFQQLNGSPALAILAHRAWLGLGIVVCGTAAAYALAYFRTLRKIVEEPDILPGSRGLGWLPQWGGSFETAVVQFSIRTLARSRQHRIILAFYLGIGFAAAIFFMKPIPMEPELAWITPVSLWRQPGVPLLASSIIMLGFWIVGNRVVFSLPLDLAANWIFRVTPVDGGPVFLRARRRALWAVALIPFWMASAILFFTIWPWTPAAAHLTVLVLMGITVAEICLAGAHKIPFTCSWLPGKANLHISFCLSFGLVVLIITKGAKYELDAFGNLPAFLLMSAILCLAVFSTRLRNRLAIGPEEHSVQFEEIPSYHLVTLDLPRDGGVVR